MVTVGEFGVVLGAVIDVVDSTVIIFKTSFVIVEDLAVIGELLVVDETVLDIVKISVVLFFGVVVVAAAEI